MPLRSIGDHHTPSFTVLCGVLLNFEVPGLAGPSAPAETGTGAEEVSSFRAHVTPMAKAISSPRMSCTRNPVQVQPRGTGARMCYRLIFNHPATEDQAIWTWSDRSILYICVCVCMRVDSGGVAAILPGLQAASAFRAENEMTA